MSRRGAPCGAVFLILSHFKLEAQAGQTRSCWCVGAWMCAHTPGKRASLVRTAAAPPFRLPCPPPRPPLYTFLFGLRLNPVSDQEPKNELSDPTNFGLVFRSPRTLRVFGDLMSNISATRGRPDMRFCVCGSPSEDLSHIASLTIGCSR